MTAQSDVTRYRQNLRGEVDSAALYRALAGAEASPELTQVYSRLAAVEDRHADVWRARLRAAGQGPDGTRPSTRARLLT